MIKIKILKSEFKRYKPYYSFDEINRIIRQYRKDDTIDSVVFGRDYDFKCYEFSKNFINRVLDQEISKKYNVKELELILNQFSKIDTLCEINKDTQSIVLDCFFKYIKNKI